MHMHNILNEIWYLGSYKMSFIIVVAALNVIQLQSCIKYWSQTDLQERTY